MDHIIHPTLMLICNLIHVLNIVLQIVGFFYILVLSLYTVLMFGIRIKISSTRVSLLKHIYN